eukprot:augustus_masked-scaffold_46-processed-gene-0.1-mRNA-1 protein AED:1.00 eAED:1.00 QI:0/0/0/0/1/1/3/483/353
MELKNNIRPLEGRADYSLWKACINAYLIEKDLEKHLEAQKQKLADMERGKVELTATEKKANAKIVGIIITRITPEVYLRIESITLAYEMLQTIEKWFTIDKTATIRLENHGYAIDAEDKVEKLLNIVKHRKVELFEVLVQTRRDEYDFDKIYTQLFMISSEIDATAIEAKQKVKSMPKKVHQNNHCKHNNKNSYHNKYCKTCRKYGHRDIDEHCKTCKKYGHKAEDCVKKERNNMATYNSEKQGKQENKLQYIYDEEENENEETDSDEEVSNIAMMEIEQLKQKETLLLIQKQDSSKTKNKMKQAKNGSEKKTKSHVFYIDSGVSCNIVWKNMAKYLTNVRSIPERRIKGIAG